MAMYSSVGRECEASLCVYGAVQACHEVPAKVVIPRSCPDARRPHGSRMHTLSTQRGSW